MFIAVDANFRLKRRAISNEARDPALGSGWGYFVEDSPYRQYLRSVTDQKEVRSSNLCRVRVLTRIHNLDQHLHWVRGDDVCEYKVVEGICINRRCYVRMFKTWLHLAKCGGGSPEGRAVSRGH